MDQGARRLLQVPAAAVARRRAAQRPDRQGAQARDLDPRAGGVDVSDASAVPRLSLERLSHSFGAVHAVRGVSMDIAPGEIHGLCGHNGAGKSTLIKMLAGIVTPDEGEIRVD